ncbi:Bug family tripartite tricarboxylate transporter substrate binding protein [Cupriavidus basilensis]|uniref:Bug family tripartite tricarboxylate transporter substrate binding protein n=1 Tax=Cupriavidus basilensis TaxID=68895 RepID=UPI000698B349|nr:tripartite tricarboxylate transporter substrate-binding protein [Cupriavidus basilensis]
MDYIMRSIAPGLGGRLGKPVVISNKPGAGAIIAASYVARAAADGHTIFGTDGSAPVLNSALYPELPYDAARDFAAVTLVARVPLLIVTHPDVPAKDLPSLIALCKRSSVSYASPGKGTYHQLAMELLKRRGSFDAVEIPFKGAAPSMQAVLAGHVPIGPLDAAIALSHLRAGKLKALAVLSKTRIPQLPNVPTAEEQGVADAEAFAWTGILAPKGTPRPIVDRLSAETAMVLKSTEIRERFIDLGMEPVGNKPAEFSDFITAEVRRWHPLIKTLGLRLA